MLEERAPVIGPADLDAGRILVTAVDVAGLDDYGDTSFVEPMCKWLESAAAEGNLTPIGAMGLQAEVINMLVNRLRFEDDLKRHPEILAEDVSGPVVIVGLSRTGTTKLQRMLSADPAVQRLSFWRISNPAPFPDSDPHGPDPRIALARAQVATLAEQMPEFMAGHPTGAEEADEEAYLLGMTFESLVNATRVRCPTYVEWWRAQPRRHPYEYLRRLLQYLQWQDGGRRGRPWVLKSPLHLGNLDLVYDTFPDATVVHTHRDPSVAVASASKLQVVFRRSGSDQVDPRENGDMMLDHWSGEMARHLAQRDQLDVDQQIIDADFTELRDEPFHVISEIYGRRGAELSSEAQSAMADWARENPQYRHGEFTYSLEEFGLTRQRVEDAFRPYLERFGTGLSDA